MGHLQSNSHNYSAGNRSLIVQARQRIDDFIEVGVLGSTIQAFSLSSLDRDYSATEYERQSNNK
jgi:hypothetical protein